MKESLRSENIVRTLFLRESEIIRLCPAWDARKTFMVGMNQ